MNTKQQDVGLILKLYELRLERPVMKIPNAREIMANRRKLFASWSKTG
jgi:hypothetical protein